MATRPWWIVRLLKRREPTPDDRRRFTECRIVGPCKTRERVDEVVKDLEVPEGWSVDFYEIKSQTRSAYFGHFRFKTAEWL